MAASLTIAEQWRADIGITRAIYAAALKVACDFPNSENATLAEFKLFIEWDWDGDKDHTLEWLERAYEERNLSLIFLNVNPNWESLRSDPRFQALLSRMRLAPY